MSNYQLLNDNNTELIYDFFNDLEYNDNLHIDEIFRLNIISDFMTLRSCIFDNSFVCFGEILDNKIKNIAIVSFPLHKSYVNYVKLHAITFNDNNFINAFLNILEDINLDDKYAKVKLILGKNKGKKCIQKLIKLGFETEIEYKVNNDVKAHISYFYKGCE